MKHEEGRTIVDRDEPLGPLASEGHGYNVDLTNQDGPGDRLTGYPRSGNAAEASATHDIHGGHTSIPVTVGKSRLGRGFWIALVVVAIVLALVIVRGIVSRSHAEVDLSQESKAESVPEVNVVYPTGGTGGGTLALPGNTQAYVDTPIYSRTNGYLQKWYFDIGAHVRKGQLMATIETPEVDQQLQQAEADLKVAQANVNLANITRDRYQNLLKSNSVSKQETDQATGDAEAKQASLEASMASVRRLQQLQSFERIYAPYDGIVTARNTDIGDLITGGSSSSASGRPLFQLAEPGMLRVFVSVPEVYTPFVRNGGTAYLTADEYPGQQFEGNIARNASAIDPASRTLNVEVDVPNKDGKLLPGAYVTVHFKVPTTGQNLTVPSNTLIFRAQGMQVGVVRDGKVQLVPVKIAADHGATVEVASGLTRDDAVVLDPSDSLTTGQPVKVKSGAAK
jgi:RND family efflux transporter MFP subunit